MELDHEIITEQDIRREKKRAQSLRQSSWWMKKTQKGVCYYCRSKVGRPNL